MLRILSFTAALAATGALAQSESSPAPGTMYTKAVHGDWSVNCVKAEGEGADECFMFQRLFREPDQPIAEVRVVALPHASQAVAGANIRVPLETVLQKGVVIAVDEGEPKVYPYHHCNREGCVSRVGFTAPELFQLEKGELAVLQVFSIRAPDTPVNIAVSLAGFTAAYDELLK